MCAVTLTMQEDRIAEAFLAKAGQQASVAGDVLGPPQTGKMQDPTTVNTVRLQVSLAALAHYTGPYQG